MYFFNKYRENINDIFNIIFDTIIQQDTVCCSNLLDYNEINVLEKKYLLTLK